MEITNAKLPFLIVRFKKNVNELKFGSGKSTAEKNRLLKQKFPQQNTVHIIECNF